MSTTTVRPAVPAAVAAWDPVRASFCETIANGHRAGHASSFQLPAELSPSGSRFDLGTPDGSTAAVMAVQGTTVPVTPTACVEGHTNVRLSGWLQASCTTRAGAHALSALRRR